MQLCRNVGDCWRGKGALSSPIWNRFCAHLALYAPRTPWGLDWIGRPSRKMAKVTPWRRRVANQRLPLAWDLWAPGPITIVLPGDLGPLNTCASQCGAQCIQTQRYPRRYRPLEVLAAPPQWAVHPGRCCRTRKTASEKSCTSQSSPALLPPQLLRNF